MDKKIKRGKAPYNIIVAILIFTMVISIYRVVFASEEESILLKEDAGNPILLDMVRKDVKGLPASEEIEAVDQLVCENENFSLYLNKEKLIVKVLDKANDYVWASGIDTDGVEELSGDWKSFSQAILVAEYLDKYAPTTLIRSYPITEDIQFIDNGFTAKVLFEELQATADISVTLNLDGITAEVLDDSIKYLQEPDKIKFTLSKLYIMPFLGAVQSSGADGYLFIPDGCGALIRFADTKKYSVAFSSRVYGKDYGIKRETDLITKVPFVKGRNVHIPVFGISHGYNDNAFVAIIENGQEYADIEGYPAGVKVEYFWATAAFNYLESYYQPTGSGSGFTHLPKTKNIVNPKITYKFLHGQDADYVGMAKKYRQTLIKRGDLKKRIKERDDIPLLLEVFMAEQKKGLFFNSTKAMTTISDVSSWVEDLHEESSIGNLLVSLKGYQKRGVSGCKLGTHKVERKTGSERELRELYEQLKAQNDKLILNMDYSRAYDHQTINANFVYNIDRSLAETYEKRPLYQKKKFINTDTITRIITSLDKLPEYKKNILLESTGNTLLSDHRSTKEETRSESLEKIIKALDRAYNTLDTMIIASPNEYAFKYADYIANIPSTHSNYIYESDTVPFLQIVLSGYVDCFAPYLNYGTYQIDDILKLIDYNMYPSYVVTEKQSAEFEDTNVNDIYFSGYKTLKPYIIESYELINEILSQVRGLSIVDREIVEDGISVVTYEDDTQIVINYTQNSYLYKDNLVEPKYAIVIGGCEK